MKTDGEAPTSYITNSVYRIAIWPTFLQIFHVLIVDVLKHIVTFVIIGPFPTPYH